MTTTGDRQFTPGTEGRSARCVLCHGEQETVIEPIEEPAPPGTTLDDFICDHCFEGLKTDEEVPGLPSGNGVLRTGQRLPGLTTQRFDQ